MVAENSKREQIILASKAILSTLPEVKTVVRSLQTYAELNTFAGTQLPLCALVGKLPAPKEKRTDRTGKVDQIISELKIDVITYFQAYSKEDTEISTLGDTIFGALYMDQYRGGLVLSTAVKPLEKTNIWRPFVAFQMTIEHTYLHTTGGF